MVLGGRVRCAVELAQSLPGDPKKKKELQELRSVSIIIRCVGAPVLGFPASIVVELARIARQSSPGDRQKNKKEEL
jgi:hypothetical protein